MQNCLMFLKKWPCLSVEIKRIDESIKPAASDNSLASALNHSNTKLQVIFDGSCFK